MVFWIKCIKYMPVINSYMVIIASVTENESNTSDQDVINVINSNLYVPIRYCISVSPEWYYKPEVEMFHIYVYGLTHRYVFLF